MSEYSGTSSPNDPVQTTEERIQWLRERGGIYNMISYMMENLDLDIYIFRLQCKLN